MMRFLILLFPFFLFSNWSDDTLLKMTLDEKIGQLFVAPACPLRDEDHWVDWCKCFKDCHIGNAILKQSDPVRQVEFLNRLQEQSSLPLLITADAEWGLGMRMSNTLSFPRNMTLGAIVDVGLIERLGREIGRQAKLVGIHMNLAPVADVNNNPANPVIHMRSFGEDPKRVAECVSAYAKGLQSVGTLACAKHFPGHGDTNVDSHRDLPVIDHDRERLEAVEFVPFKQVVQEGIAALMTAHLYVPSIDPIYPTSLSASCLAIAREEMHFDGLIISDAMNMKAINDRYSPEEAALLARKAGCDLLLYGDHIAPNVDEIMHKMIPKAYQALKEAYVSGKLAVQDLDESVLRILRAKEQLGLHESRQIALGDLSEALHRQEALDLKKQLFQEAVTILGELPPLPENTTYLSFGQNDVLGGEFKAGSSGDCVVIAVHQKEALTEEVLAQIESLSDRAILCLFTTPYVLKHFKNQKAILLGYENDPDAQCAVHRVLTGQVTAKGHLPVTIED
jgi:beta-glucosidase-like glycosyl hydrolase